MTPHRFSARLAATGMVAGLAAALLPVLVSSPAQAAQVARPTEDVYQAPEATPVCREDICVHYAQDGTNDVPAEDDGAAGSWKGYADNGVPDYVDLISASLLPKAAKVFADAGYRAPVGDGALGGGTDQLDFYLADLADVDGGAYCTRASGDDTQPSAGFCVLDNDYAPAEYGTRLNPVANLGLDVVHQYAYLAQWAYPSTDWIAAVAAWVEDEVYPTLNRNRAYLRNSPLAKPGTSMIDVLGDDAPGHALGRWIFLRYLSERFPAEVGGLPVVVRDIVEHRAKAALASRGTTMLQEFTTFTTWNRNPAAFYDEGAAYPTAPLARNVMLSRVTNTRTFTGGGSQWTSDSYRFRPSSTLTGSWRIRLANRSESLFGGAAEALVATFKAKGKPAVTRVFEMDGTGNITLAFNTSVEWVELRVVTGEVSVGGNPSETGEPTHTVTAKVSRG